MRSSWISAQACTSSSALIARSTVTASGESTDPPAPRQPHHAKVGRMRLPPFSTNATSWSAASANTGSIAAASAARASRKDASAASIAPARPASSGRVGGAAAPPAGSGTAWTAPARVIAGPRRAGGGVGEQLSAPRTERNGALRVRRVGKARARTLCL